MRKSAHIMILLAFILGIYLPGEANPAAKKGRSLSAYQGYQSIKEVKFRKIFKEYLYQRLEKEPSDVMVSRLKVLGNRPVPPGKISFEVFQKDKRRLGGQVNLVAIVMSNGVVKNRVRLSGWVDVFESVVLTSRNLKKREIIKKEDIYLARKNISHLSPNILTDMSKAVGLMAKHNLKEGAILKEWMLEKSPIVKRGDMVTILAESGHLRVTVPGRVLEKGYLGEIIRVQNTMSKKKIHARVINNSTVMVYF
jgi:flagella basal body P-ring formation protein FlgA